MRGRGKRTKAEREADLVVIADLYRRGCTQKQIATLVTSKRSYSISHVTVKNDLDLIFKRWREKQAKYIDNFLVAQLSQIQALKAEAWKEYEKRKLPKKRIKESRKGVTSLTVKPLRKTDDIIEEEFEEIEAIFDQHNTEELTEVKGELDNIDIQFTDLSPYMGIEVTQDIEVSERTGDPRYLDLISKLMEQEAKLLGFYKNDTSATNTSVIVVNMPEPVNKNKFISPNNNT